MMQNYDVRLTFDDATQCTVKVQVARSFNAAICALYAAQRDRLLPKDAEIIALTIRRA